VVVADVLQGSGDRFNQIVLADGGHVQGPGKGLVTEIKQPQSLLNTPVARLAAVAYKKTRWVSSGFSAIVATIT
jgi:hypothetical protein